MPDSSASKGAARPLFARRRRVFLMLGVVIVVAVSVLANYDPVSSYLEARSRLEKTEAEVAALEQEKAELQSQLGKLAEAEYLEAVAREALTYARPGEDVYIITGSADEEAPSSTSTGGGAGAEGSTQDSSRDETANMRTAMVGGGAGSSDDPAELGEAQPGLFEKLITRLVEIF